MKKLGLLLISATGAMVLAGCSANAAKNEKLPERNQRIIVELDYDVDKLTEDGIKDSQAYVYNNIKTYATRNVKKLQSYDTLVNGLLLSVNEEDVEKIKQVPGVKSVTIDKRHAEKVFNGDDGAVPLYISKDPTPEPEENVSATTMQKPTVTNDGEGTIVAILDNEFHFRGATDEDEAWHHEVFDPLEASVKKRYDFTSISNVKGLRASRKSGATAGQEGSLYFNSKVPFYYDYGGVSSTYSGKGTPQWDVHSKRDYHGSHVASITAGNASTYSLFKGIAPKAQLACMKVFTEFDSKAGVGEAIGLSDSSGAYDSVILNALEDCVKLKVDGINMSLGSDLDDFDSDSITLKTLTKLKTNGILSAISAGNSGKTSFSFAGAYGNWGTEMVETGILSSYANNAASTTVASGQPTRIFYEYAFELNIGLGKRYVAYEDQIVNRPGTDDDYSEEFRMSDIVSTNAPWIYVPGFGSDADYTGLNVSGKVAVVNRGSTSFADKYSVAKSKGAIALVIINNDPTASDFNFRCSFGDGFNPTMPCALVLYKDKQTFEGLRNGTYNLITDKEAPNENAFKMSTFSSDGATFDLDLKPEITAPGDIIKGAVPEFALTNKTPAEREALKYHSYAYLSGTSMSSPNYAGAQSVVLSKVAAEPAATETQIADFRKTVDMRLMSTAVPMTDINVSPESDPSDEPTVTSPRLQGAGMVNLDGALNTDVYLEGLDMEGTTGLGKSKIVLRDNPDIAKGDIKLSFLAHNDSDEDRHYNVWFNVMRPGIAHPNDLVSKEYNYKGEIENIEYFPGKVFYDTSLGKMVTASGSYAYKDVYKVSRDIEYFSSEEAYDEYNYWMNVMHDPEKAREYYTVIPKGYYYNSSQSGAQWDDLPSHTAQSVMDTEIGVSIAQTVTIPANAKNYKVTLNTYSLSEEQKNAILEVYNYGCVIEGYVSLESLDSKPDLSIPYLGFYAGADRDPNASYSSAPAVEPMNFEKDPTKIYPSDYVNDITKELIGKDKVNFESMMVAGHLDSPDALDKDKILTNDLAFDGLTGFYNLGTDPETGEYLSNPSENLYLGSDNTNTLIIQQFVLRSVADNYFTIVNKETGQEIYRDVLEDMLFGDSAGKWALYKSHVDAGYLSSGYVAHRAYAVVPLYDVISGEAFPSGEYELKFNYLLASTGKWVDKSYTLHIDSDAPTFKEVKEVKRDGVDYVRFNISDHRISYGVIGYNRVEAHYDAENNVYYLEEEKSFVKECLNEVSSTGGRRLFVRAVDFARGTTGCLIHLEDENNFSKGVTTVQGKGLTVAHDYKYEKGILTIIDNNGNEVKVDGDLYINNVKYNPDTPSVNPKKANYTWVIVLASVGGGLLLIGGGVFLFFFLRKKKLLKGGK